MDPEAVPTPTNPQSEGNHMQGRLLRTRAHTEDRRIQPLHHSTGKNQLPELPRRHQAPQRATPREERPDTIHPHNEICQRQPDPNMGRHPGQDHHSREGNQADALCQPRGKQAIPEPVLMQGPGPAGTRQLPREPGDSHHQEQPNHDPPGRSLHRRAGRQSDQTSTCNPHRPHRPHQPHQIMLLSHQVPTTRQAYIATIPGDGSKQAEDGGVPAQLVLLQLVQHMRAPDPADDDRPTLGPLD